MYQPNQFKRIAFVGNYVPRQCGIATFTTDLCEAVAAAAPETSCFAVPVNDIAGGYAYPPRVRFEIEERDLATYRRAADFLNTNNVDLVCLQHEYGIFGGPAGSHILTLLADLRMPVVTTLHTVLRQPDAQQRRVMERLAELSDRVVVMSQRGVAFLRQIYGVPAEKIDLIPHGIPDVPFVDPNFFKDRFGVEGKLVLLTFGLLSPNKGIEHVLDAMPAILARHPQVVYIVLGATHPHIKRQEGETYRLSLQRRARTLGIDKHILFFDRFVTLEELIEFIGAADLYLTPYLNEAQITSGTLAYTVGAGKAVISTPYWYAEELLAEGRGVLVPFGDSRAIAERVIELLENEAERHAIRKRAYLLGREMIWPRVACRYLESFALARETRTRHPRRAFTGQTLDKRPPELPALNLSHLRRLTDDVGLLQHAYFSVPNYTEGYTTDDNARALVVAVLLEEAGGGERPARVPLGSLDSVLEEGASNQAYELASRYLAFLWYAFNPEEQRFRNFLPYDRCWRERMGSEDCHGRALWALGTAIGRCQDVSLRGAANRLFDGALPAVRGFTSPRAWSYTLLGIDEYLRRFAGDRAARSLCEELAERLLELYRTCSDGQWRWFEERLAYANGVLPHALLVSGHTLGREEMIETALESLEWLAALQKADRGHFVPIGSNGFYVRGGERARFDQQPVEAQTMVSACLAARAVTQQARWGDFAQLAFDWFLGRNDLGQVLYDPKTGGCRDGLHPDRCNENQGAESTLAFWHALLEMRLSETLMEGAAVGDEGGSLQPKALSKLT
ncbi:MAG: glycosyltransferase family 4 protein [Pirellulales bacterium]|nr:glycosyltransferase family 4 protein [Pirellulales bacterium]